MRKYRILQNSSMSVLEDRVEELMRESDNLYELIGTECIGNYMVLIFKLNVDDDHQRDIDYFKDRKMDIGYPGVNIPKPSIEPINGPKDGGSSYGDFK